MVYCVVSLKEMVPNVVDNLTHYESVNSYKIGYLKCALQYPHSSHRDDNFRFFNPFNQGVMKNIAEFFHLSTDWYLF